MWCRLWWNVKASVTDIIHITHWPFLRSDFLFSLYLYIGVKLELEVDGNVLNQRFWRKLCIVSLSCKAFHIQLSIFPWQNNCKKWTNEEHNRYLHNLEMSFVKQLHNSMHMHAWYRGQSNSVASQKELVDLDRNSEQVGVYCFYSFNFYLFSFLQFFLPTLSFISGKDELSIFIIVFFLLFFSFGVPGHYCLAR